ncbi:peptidase M14 [Mesorhizobium sp.]|uniref:peptidase M14 n=1 Tax=Mesorhizobium sp. TaxID=1871066 RepID=UPI000FE575E3|nr:peptidase M14 [Mesorhizobium sp.]RWK11046.1 MAG: peptidase M14 [Mesorhizobium sp.]TIQ49643.1 MAG: peptidase M14 [Mesorhizobium sp.]TIQ59354.1 MAG: peptidase M14 [Mesorhizobium sp.]TJV91879.1 MAG: peptidase M14 [Mesorhizobium sp.]
MTMIYQGTFERTLNQLVARFAEAQGSRIEAWTFDDETSRRAAELKLAKFGVEARFRSAYKPLLHFFLEEVDIASLSAIHVIYPMHSICHVDRFRSETYPLAALVGKVALTFEAGTQEDLFYQVRLGHKDGYTSAHSVFAPNRVHVDTIGVTHVSPTGWIRIDGASPGERLQTDYEMLFEVAVQAVAAHEWGREEPYFEELNIAVALPTEDRRLPVGQEVISLLEAMHEDLYFSIIEVFQKKSGRALGDWRGKPGQIVPEIRYVKAAPAVRIETRPLTETEAASKFMPLNQAETPISAAQVRAELVQIGGDALEARSRSGRSVTALYRKGFDRPVIISAGRHANETTGIVGALRAAHALAARPEAHFVVSPLENPDGYQLHWRLRTDNPYHLHHAARYTALGDDFLNRATEPLFEKAIHKEAQRLSGAKLHLDLHGYPSHEWSRPLSGYLPLAFEKWAVPRGFCLLMQYHTGWEDAAELLIDKITRRLASLPGLIEFNAAQIGLFQTHCGETEFQMTNGVPCLIWEDNSYSVPILLTSEYPDETIYGRAFIAGHDAQTEFVLAAYESYQQFTAEETSRELTPAHKLPPL